METPENPLKEYGVSAEKPKSRHNKIFFKYEKTT
jgi:hypothetical protein